MKAILTDGAWASKHASFARRERNAYVEIPANAQAMRSFVMCLSTIDIRNYRSVFMHR